MAYDETLAERIRDRLADEPGVTERRMFGGLGFMIEGHLAVAAASSGGLMVRVDPERSEELAGDGAAPMVMRGRPMAGWLLVDRAALDDDAVLGEWVGVGTAYARSLPPKPGR